MNAPFWRITIPCVLAVVLTLQTSTGVAQTTIGSITTTEGDVSVSLMGFGLVVGLDGTGDRNIAGPGRSGGTSARAVANLLQRFGMSVDDDLLRVRNVAAVIVQARVNPYLRAGQKFDIQVSSLHDASSLKGGQLLMMPLLMDLSDTIIVAIGAGDVMVYQDPAARILRQGGASGRVPEGGLVEVDLPRPQVSLTPTLSLNAPDVTMASRIAAVINSAIGDGTATILDPGTIQLNPPTGAADNQIEFLAGIDTLSIAPRTPPRVVINQHDGSISTVGTIMLNQGATVTVNGITLTIGQPNPTATPVPGLLEVAVGVSVQDIAAGLHAAGANPQEIALMFERLRSMGVISADIEIQ